MKAVAVLAFAVLAPLLLVLAPLGGRSLETCDPQAWEEQADRSGVVGADALDAGQLRNASVIADRAVARGLGRAGAVIGVMTALTESSLRNVGHGDAAGPDSRGLFQQRSSWGPLAVRMSPGRATDLFFSALESTPGWQRMAPWRAAQSVQRSAFANGSNYRRHYETAVDAVDQLLSEAGEKHLRTVAMSSGVCDVGMTPGATRVPIPAAPLPYRGGRSGCVLPDPTGTGGCIARATAHLLRETSDAFASAWPWGVSCWDEHAWSPHSDHPRGRACDFTVGQLGTYPNEAEVRHGWSLAEWLRVYATRLGIDYVIWDGRIWSQSRVDEGWRRYDGGGIYDVRSPSGGHRDHLHVSLLDTAQ